MSKNRSASDSSPKEFIVVAKGAGIVLLGTVIGSGLRILFRALIGRNLGPYLLGLFLIGLGLFRILERVACLGIQNGILRYVPLYLGEKDDKRLKGTIILGLRVVGVAGVCVGAVLLIGSNSIADYIYHNHELAQVLRAFAIAIPFSALSTVLLFSTQGFRIMNYKVYVREFIEPLSRILVYLMLFLLGWKLFGALSAFLLSVVLGTLAASYYLKRVYPSIFLKKSAVIFEARKMFHFSWPLFFVGFFYLIILWMNTLMIGYFLSADDVGIFGAAHSIAMLGLIVVNAFVSIFAPVVSDLSNRREKRKLESLFKLVTKWIFSLSLPIFILMIFFAEDILRLSFGEEFVQGGIVLVVLSIALLINSMFGASGFLTAMSGKPKIEFFNLGIVLFLNAAFSIVLIPRWGIRGAAYSTLAAFILLNVLRIIEVGVLFRIFPFRRDFYKPILAGCISFLILYLAANHIPFSANPSVSFFGGSIVFVCVYILGLLSMGLAEEDRLVFSRIKEKIKRR